MFFQPSKTARLIMSLSLLAFIPVEMQGPVIANVLHMPIPPWSSPVASGAHMLYGIMLMIIDFCAIILGIAGIDKLVTRTA